MSRRTGARPRKRNRGQVIEELNAAVRRSGRHAVFFHSAVAEVLGLSAADSRALSYLEESGSLTAGELAELTGLTTGAITGMIDRLERAGMVRREADPEDRRKVIVVPVADALARATATRLFAPLDKAFRKLTASYTNEQLAIVLQFINEASDMLQDQTGRVLRISETQSIAEEL